METVGAGFYVVMGFVALLEGLMFAVLPRLTRPDIFFSVTVPSTFRDSEKGRAIASGFRRWMLAATFLAAGLVALAAVRRLPGLALAAVVGLVVAVVPPFLAARRRTQPFAAAPTGVREAALAPRQPARAGQVLLFTGPFLIIAIAAFSVLARWRSVPDLVPVHWGLDGRADGFVARTPGHVAALFVSATVLCALLAVLGWGIGHWTRRVRASGPGASAESRFRRLFPAALVVACYLTALPAALLGLLAFGIESVSPWVWLLPTLVLLALVARAAWLGQGGTRLVHEPIEGRPVGDRTPDSDWKLGLFYVNRADPALLVEKRFGVGYTFNFGNPMSWLILVLLVGVPLTLAIVFGGSAR